MPPVVSHNRDDTLTEADRAAMQELSLAVYPPDVAANWPGRHLEWSPPESWVRVWADDQLASCTGVLLRDATQDGQPVLIGGIGGVKTHPDYRRRGFAELAIGHALKFFQSQPSVAFGLLVCKPELIPYYSRLGWQEFDGTLVVRQHGTPAEFTYNRVMVCEIQTPAPAGGAIDLQGPPW